MKKSIPFLYISPEQVEFETKNTIPYISTPECERNTSINLTEFL